MIKCENGCIVLELPKDSRKINKFVNYINKKGVKSFDISAKKELQFSLNFLNNISSPQSIKKIGLFGNFTDYEVIYRFTELSELSVSIKVERVIDLFYFHNLKTLSTPQLYPFTNLDNTNIEELLYGDALGEFDFEAESVNSLKNLKFLYLGRVKNFSFNQISNLKNLVYLKLTQCKIVNFNGINELKKLNSLLVYYCRTLKSIKDIEELTNLQYLWFCACPNIEDIEVLSEIKNLIFLYLENMEKYSFEFAQNLQSKETLQFLGFENCESLSSIKFLESMPELLTFFFYKTNIIDGDLRPCLKLKHVFASNKRHYNMKINELPSDSYNYAITRWLSF